MLHRDWHTGARLLTATSAATVLLGLAGGQATASAATPPSCGEVRLAPYSACISSEWVNRGEDWLIAGEGEAGRGKICVYLSRWAGRSFAWNGSSASCEGEPSIATLGASGHPTIYNGTGRWLMAHLTTFD